MAARAQWFCGTSVSGTRATCAPTPTAAAPTSPIVPHPNTRCHAHALPRSRRCRSVMMAPPGSCVRLRGGESFALVDAKTPRSAAKLDGADLGVLASTKAKDSLPPPARDSTREGRLVQRATLKGILVAMVLAAGVGSERWGVGAPERKVLARPGLFRSLTEPPCSY